MRLNKTFLVDFVCRFYKNLLFLCFYYQNIRSWSFIVSFAQGQKEIRNVTNSKVFMTKPSIQSGITPVRFGQLVLLQSSDFLDHLNFNICPKGRIYCLDSMLNFF